MLHDPDWSPIFAPDGQLLKEGEVLRRTNLSRTLSVIAEEGPDAFYKVCPSVSFGISCLIAGLVGSNR